MRFLDILFGCSKALEIYDDSKALIESAKQIRGTAKRVNDAYKTLRELNAEQKREQR